jgi:predicted helicase
MDRDFYDNLKQRRATIQSTWITSLCDHFAAGNRRALLVAPCGVGKTVVAIQVAKQRNWKRWAVVASSLAQIPRWLEEIRVHWPEFLADDTRVTYFVGDANQHLTADEEQEEKEFATTNNLTRNSSELSFFLADSARGGRNHLVFSLWRSGAAFSSGLSEEVKIDGMLLDEAHNAAVECAEVIEPDPLTLLETVVEGKKVPTLHWLDDLLINADERLFLTATPKSHSKDTISRPAKFVFESGVTEEQQKAHKESLSVEGRRIVTTTVSMRDSNLFGKPVVCVSNGKACAERLILPPKTVVSLRLRQQAIEYCYIDREEEDEENTEEEDEEEMEEQDTDTDSTLFETISSLIAGRFEGKPLVCQNCSRDSTWTRRSSTIVPFTPVPLLAPRTSVCASLFSFATASRTPSCSKKRQ